MWKSDSDNFGKFNFELLDFKRRVTILLWIFMDYVQKDSSFNRALNSTEQKIYGYVCTSLDRFARDERESGIVQSFSIDLIWERWRHWWILNSGELDVHTRNCHIIRFSFPGLYIFIMFCCWVLINLCCHHVESLQRFQAD